MTRTTLLTVAVIVLAIIATTANAQLVGSDTSPGESCAGFPAGATRVTADSDQNGADITLVCDGTVWNAQGVKVYYDTTTCAAAKNGTIRYISTGDPPWEYCDGSAWVPFESAAATGGGCTLGDNYGGGICVGVSLDKIFRHYNLIMIPGGCTDSATPTCDGSDDTTTKAFGNSGTDIPTHLFDGVDATAELVATPGHAAAEYCDDITYAGFDDWYLPSVGELAIACAGMDCISSPPYGIRNFPYVTANQGNSTNQFEAAALNPSRGNSFESKDTTLRVRCFRREIIPGSGGGGGCTPGAAVGDGVCGGQISGVDGVFYDLIVTRAGCASSASSAAQCSGTDGAGQQFIWSDAVAVGPVPVLEAWESVATLPGAGGPGPVTDIDVNKPTGTVAGDLLLTIVSVDAGSTDVTMPSGFTELTDGSASHLAVGYKLAGASEPATYNVSWGFSEDAIVYMLRFSGVDPADPVATTTPGGGSSATAIEFNPLTTSKANSYVIGTAATLAGTGFEGGTGWASFTAIDLLDNSFANQVIVGFDTFATSGSTADDTFTGGGTVNYKSILVEIKAISTTPAVDTTDFMDGAANQAETIAHGNANGYQTPAADYCDGLTIDSANWHLPAAHELETIHLNFASAGSWTNADFITLSSAYYWQSSERGDLKAWNSQVYNGDVLRAPDGLDDKSDSHYVRCVRREAAQ